MEKEIEDMSVSERLRESAQMERDSGYSASEHELNEAATVIDALVAALETARASVAGEWGEDHPEVKDIDAALALAHTGVK